MQMVFATSITALIARREFILLKIYIKNIISDQKLYNKKMKYTKYIIYQLYQYSLISSRHKTKLSEKSSEKTTRKDKKAKNKKNFSKSINYDINERKRIGRCWSTS